jgi:multiple sugar transport system substrate-binding protein
MKKIIIVVLLLSVVVGILFWKFSSGNRQQQATGPITLNIWGLWEDDSEIKPALDAYEKDHPNVKVNYAHQSSINYRTRVQTQIAAGQGPDIFMIHDSWVPMFLVSNSLGAMPSSVMTPSEFSTTFYPVAKDTLIQNNNIYALPLEVDGLGLFYNSDILKAANVTPPKYWLPTAGDPGFVNDAVKMTVKDSGGIIKTAGAAMGTTSNVDSWPDILGLLFLQQPGANLEQPNNAFGAQVLQFYTGFILNPAQKTWDATLENSTQAFEEGKLAFYFAPSWRADEIRVVNPGLNFGVAPVPQLPGNQAVNWATFWAFSVAANSQNQAASWDLLKYLTSADAEKANYQEAVKTRLIGEPYSRVDLGPSLAQDPIAGAFVTQAPTYHSWYLSSRTFDSGINDEMIKYYEDAINSVLQGKFDANTSLTTASQGVQQVLQKYTKPQSAPAASGK